MKIAKFLIAVLLGIVLPASSYAGKIVTDSIHSVILGADVTCNIYLPDGYDVDGTGYPVIYLLHGLTDTYTAWVEKGNMIPLADELIETGESLPVVIVMPNAGGPDTVNTWNGYFNMPGWNYEDFFFGELMPWVESKYNAGGSKERRAIMGLSMGGGGSTVYCQRHPECFSSCYAMSAWLDNDESLINGGGEENKFYHVCKAVHDRSALTFMENADETAIAGLRTVKWFIDCGDDDFLFDLSVRLHQLMRDRGVKSELRVRNGVHNWEYWHDALRMALPYASRNFSK